MEQINETLVKLSQYLEVVGFSEPRRVISLYDAHRWFMETYKIRVLATVKTNGSFGVEFYKVNEENPIGQPFVRVNGSSAYTMNFEDFYDAIAGGMVYAFKNILKISLPDETNLKISL